MGGSGINVLRTNHAIPQEKGTGLMNSAMICPGRYIPIA